MRCKACNYSLWNLKARTCPECGVPFKPSDYRFVPNSVRFCCPHCGQGYFGTDANGHLFPNAFTCVSCAKLVAMDEMIVQPADGVNEDQTQIHRLPWLDDPPKPLGVFSRWFKTVGMAAFRPMSLGEALTTSRPTQSSLLFMLMTSLVVAFGGSLIWGAFVAVSIFGVGSGGPGGPGSAGWAFWGAQWGVVFLGYFVGLPLLLLLWALCAHALLAVTGGTNGGLSRTIQSVCYASGACVFFLVPCVGGYGLAQIWTVVSVCLILTVSQRVSGYRATFAGLGPPLALVLIAVVSIVLLVAQLTRAAAAAAPPPGMPPPPTMVYGPASVQPQDAHDRLVELGKAIAEHIKGSGAYPKHGLELATGDGFSFSSYVVDSNHVDAAHVEGRTLRYYQTMNSIQASKLVEGVAERLPENAVAHRVGDFVFTCRGVMIPPQDPGLWIAVYSPSPGFTHDPSILAVRCVLDASGNTDTFSVDQWSEAVAAQNELRKKHGLPVLPDPDTLADGGVALE